jgi:GT2 family glycosyltransferase
MTDSSGEKALTLDALIICFNRQDEVERAVESCQVDGIERILVLDNASNPPISIRANSILERSNENLGPCKGRNFLARVSTADLVLFLDDDALLGEEVVIPSLIKEFEDNPSLVVLAGLVRRGNGEITNIEFPARKVSRISESREVGYFVEGMSIVRRSAFVNLGGFDQTFFYGHEATDFSLRLASISGEIFYDPRLAIVHCPSSKGRDLTAKNYSRQMRNRKILAWRSLPRPVSYFHLTIWFVYYLLNSSPTVFFSLAKSALSPITKEEKTIGRLPLPYRKLNQLQKIGYRIYW